MQWSRYDIRPTNDCSKNRFPRFKHKKTEAEHENKATGQTTNTQSVDWWNSQWRDTLGTPGARWFTCKTVPVERETIGHDTHKLHTSLPPHDRFHMNYIGECVVEFVGPSKFSRGHGSFKAKSPFIGRRGSCASFFINQNAHDMSKILENRWDGIPVDKGRRFYANKGPHWWFTWIIKSQRALEVFIMTPTTMSMICLTYTGQFSLEERKVSSLYFKLFNFLRSETWMETND